MLSSLPSWEPYLPSCGIHRTGDLVIGLQVRLRDRQVPLGHLHCTVPQTHPQRVRVATVAQVLDRVGVPEPVDIGAGDPGPLTDHLDRVVEVITGDPPIGIGDE